jgi:hypothetical protein
MPIEMSTDTPPPPQPPSDHPEEQMEDVQVSHSNGARPQMKRVLSDLPEPKTKSGASGATSNLVNAIVGSGIIGIPFTIRESGLVMGLFLLMLVSYLASKLSNFLVAYLLFYCSFCTTLVSALYFTVLVFRNLQKFTFFCFFSPLSSHYF